MSPRNGEVLRLPVLRGTVSSITRNYSRISPMSNHFVEDLPLDRLNTPSFIYDEESLARLLTAFNTINQSAGVRLLYSLKANALLGILDFLAPHLAGFAASSPFELRLAHDLHREDHCIHYNSPGLSPKEIPQVGRQCDFLSLNSIQHYRSYTPSLDSHTSLGIRINPQLSLVADNRCDPCRLGSQLGVPISSLRASLADDASLFNNLSGLHFHTNCESRDFADLLATAQKIRLVLPHLLDNLRWINIGGGYLFTNAQNSASFSEAVDLLRGSSDCAVYCEPGAGLVAEAAILLCEVVDIFISDSQQIAIVDTTVNHLPEVLQFDTKPRLLEHDAAGPYSYVIAGCTCLPADVFGRYSLIAPLKVGHRLVFLDVGAYSYVKMDMFNGVSLPAVYRRQQDGTISLERHSEYWDYASRNWPNRSAILGVQPT